MKATGIVRRIDDLGRVVIPKEIRRTLRIREGDPIEIFVRGDGEVVLKKFSPIGEISKAAANYVEILHKFSDMPIAICDKDHVISAAGIPKKEILERRISPELEEIMKSRQTVTEIIKKPIEGIDKAAVMVTPIIVNSDIVGSIIMLSQNGETKVTPQHEQTMLMAASILEKELEE